MCESSEKGNVWWCGGEGRMQRRILDEADLCARVSRHFSLSLMSFWMSYLERPKDTISRVALSMRGSESRPRPPFSSSRLYTVLRGRIASKPSKSFTPGSAESMSRYTSLPYSERILSGFIILYRRPTSKASCREDSSTTLSQHATKYRIHS